MIVLWILLILAALCLLAIKPRLLGRPDTDWMFYQTPCYAHRGLHDNEGPAPENSMPALRTAIELSYGIELDVQLTKDRIPVVFHDETLDRICGVSGKVRDYTYEELQQFRLCKSEEKIPLLKDVLDMVNGRGPVILEIKAYEDPNLVCTYADQVIAPYQGSYCIESFHPLVLLWYRMHRPRVMRGQLSSNFNTPDRKEPIQEALVHHLLLNFLGNPDFIAYDYQHKDSFFRKLCQLLFHPLAVCWTIRSQEELVEARKHFKLYIFEGFRPNQKAANR